MTRKITLFLMIWLLALNGAGFYDGTTVPHFANVAPEAEEIAVFESETEDGLLLLYEYELPDRQAAEQAAAGYSALLVLTGNAENVRIRAFENEGLHGVVILITQPCERRA